MHPTNKLISMIRLMLLFAITAFASIDAKAEYYIVYPASISPMPCTTCQNTTVQTAQYNYTSPPHHHYRHIKFRKHLTKNSVNISVYYLVPPYGCEAGACHYAYQPCPGCQVVKTKIMQETPCPGGSCYVTPDDDDNVDMDTKTSDDMRADLEINDP